MQSTSSALPLALKYEPKVMAGTSKTFTSNMQPQGALSGYTPGSICTINIGTESNMVLCPQESVLKFTVVPITTAGPVQRLDSAGAHGFIRRIRVYHGSNMLEDIQEYGLLAKMFLDLQVNTCAFNGKHNILSGTRSDLYVPGIAASTTPNVANQRNTGVLIPDAGATFHISLVSILSLIHI